MLKLKNIRKEYVVGDTTVHALKGVDIEFRQNEFVAILGQSGCGKTTLLNIIGGLDKYTAGDLIINGRSTKEYKDRDWDTYRNHSIGFVFQSYNLIPHQTVLSNVELALTLSGVSKTERRERAIDALTKVGLADQIKKKPNQMSGGQMQRVAIARALVNEPDILLADEPTGALDSETSVQIMEILKEIAKDKLIIMVTHNPDLAEEYASRTIRLLDGNVIDDSDPYEVAEYSTAAAKKEKVASEKKDRKTSMSFFTALSLSLNNLMTKKTRTFMTAFAGSIGIIGIALILALSNGIQLYIDKVQEDTLASYPIAIEAETVDYGSLMTSLSKKANGEKEHELDRVYSNTIMMDMMNTMLAEVEKNNLEAFKKFIEGKDSGFDEHVSAIEYGYNLPLPIFASDTEKDLVQVNPSKLFGNMTGGSESGGMGIMSSMGGGGFEVWDEMLGNKELLNSQYDVVAGVWPNKYNEVVLVVDSNNEINDMVLYSLGLKDSKEAEEIMKAAMKGETFETNPVSFSYDELIGLTYKLVLPTNMYEFNEEEKAWEDKKEDEEFMKAAIEAGLPLTIVGIIRPSEDAVSTAITGTVGYLSDLTKYVVDEINSSKIVKAQLDNPDVDIFTGNPFELSEEEQEVTMTDVNEYLASLPEEERMQIQGFLATMSEEQILEMFKEQLKPEESEATFDENVKKLGIVDLEKPDKINIYATTFDAKEEIASIISAYNDKMTGEGKDEYVIHYTDLVGLMMSSISTIINVISYVLIAFVAISLVVSSIMIGIITYISVLERTKEIGILRAIGASKKDISRVFNAETLIVGFVSGGLGIGITLLLTIPINFVIKAMTDINNVALLPVAGAVILILISMGLTLLAGLIPSKIAAKKDPVEALRTE